MIEKGGFFNGNVTKIEKAVEKPAEKAADPTSAALAGARNSKREDYPNTPEETEGSADASYTRATTTTRSDARFFTNTAEQPDATP